MNLVFKTLSKMDFKLLLKWLEEPHVKAWWDQDTHWTSDLIYKKYLSYTKGYTLENGTMKAIHAYIMYMNDGPIGYIQLYNAYDFTRSVPLIGLPQSLAAFDVFIGEKQFLNRGIGAKAIAHFLDEYAHAYAYAFADPERTNISAIRAYKKAGFKEAVPQPSAQEIWLLRAMSK